jgi:hypothetical protein
LYDVDLTMSALSAGLLVIAMMLSMPGGAQSG